MNINQSEFEDLCIYAMRYAMGRPSYAAFEVCGIIVRNWKDISPPYRSRIHKEATEHAQSPSCDFENRRYYERIAALPVEDKQ